MYWLRKNFRKKYEYVFYLLKYFLSEVNKNIFILFILVLELLKLENCYFYIISYEIVKYGCGNNVFFVFLLLLVNELYRFKSLLYVNWEKYDVYCFLGLI